MRSHTTRSILREVSYRDEHVGKAESKGLHAWRHAAEPTCVMPRAAGGRPTHSRPRPRALLSPAPSASQRGWKHHGRHRRYDHWRWHHHWRGGHGRRHHNGRRWWGRRCGRGNCHACHHTHPHSAHATAIERVRPVAGCPCHCSRGTGDCGAHRLATLQPSDTCSRAGGQAWLPSKQPAAGTAQCGMKTSRPSQLTLGHRNPFRDCAGAAVREASAAVRVAWWGGAKRCVIARQGDPLRHRAGAALRVAWRRRSVRQGAGRVAGQPGSRRRACGCAACTRACRCGRCCPRRGLRARCRGRRHRRQRRRFVRLPRFRRRVLPPGWRAGAAALQASAVGSAVVGDVQRLAPDGERHVASMMRMSARHRPSAPSLTHHVALDRAFLFYICLQRLGR